jgi:stalled ribosome rescue protein Dom34
LAQVGKAAVTGRVATLLIESDRQIAGRLDSSTGHVETADLSDPQVDDLLDDLGELVAKMGGKVVVVPKEQMPGPTGLAAIFRY